MGACNCKEEDNIDSGNIDASEIQGKSLKRRVSNLSICLAKTNNKEEKSCDLNQENANTQKCCDYSGLLEQEKSVKMAEYQTRGEELPFSQYASVQVGSEKGENQLVFNNGQFKENSFTKANDSEKEQEESILLTFEQEYQYTELSTNIFNFLNSLRTTPEKFENEFDQRLESVFKMLLNKEEKPEIILWSQNLYDTCFEKFMTVKNEKLQDTYEELTQTILERLGAAHDKSHSIVYSCHLGKYEAKNVIWNLLANEDDQVVHSILFDNFIYGTVISLPGVDKEQDRYVLVLVRRN